MKFAMKKCAISRKDLFVGGAIICLMALMITIVPTFAATGIPSELKAILDDMIYYVGLIFQVVGVFLGIYAVGQMIFSFKDDNPDGKARAATLLVTALILLVLPQIIESLDLTKYLG